MLYSICQQIWKTEQCHKTGKGQFSFQSRRKAMPKNAQTTIQLCSFHMLARSCSKSFKISFITTWTENFWRYKLGSKEAEEPEIKLSTSDKSQKKKLNSKKPSTSVSFTRLKLLTVWITTNWKSFKEMGIPDHLTCLLRNLYVGQEATVRTGHGTNWLVPNLERSMTRLYIVTRLI